MYAVVALGYTMVYGIIQLINFAHGEVVMIGAMVAYTVISLPQINQVYMMFRARLTDVDFGPGTESLEVRLFEESEIPWEQLAFRTIARTLRNFFLDRRLGRFALHVSSIERRAPLPPDLLAAG